MKVLIACEESQNVELFGEKVRERIKERDKAIEFFMQFVNADCDKQEKEQGCGLKDYRNLLQPNFNLGKERKLGYQWSLFRIYT